MQYIKMWHAAKAVLRGNFIALHLYITKEERSQVNNINFCLKKSDKERQNKPNAEGRV